MERVARPETGLGRISPRRRRSGVYLVSMHCTDWLVGGGVESVSYRNSVSYLCFLVVERLRYLENARTGTPGIKRSRFLADRSAK